MVLPDNDATFTRHADCNTQLYILDSGSARPGEQETIQGGAGVTRGTPSRELTRERPPTPTPHL